MSEEIKHECGIALIKLKKPKEYYQNTFGTEFYGLQKMKVLLEKQRNRGQDGAGIAIIDSKIKPCYQYLDITKSIAPDPISDLFRQLDEKVANSEKLNLEQISGDLLLGHLRYGTYASYGIENVHPFVRLDSWRSRSLILAGNFNLTNIDELLLRLMNLGQHPRESADTVIVLEKISHFLNAEVQRVFEENKNHFSGLELSNFIESNLDILQVIKKSVKHFDGGFALAGLTGFGSAFVVRDQNSIRPVYFFENDDLVAVASERSPLVLAFNTSYSSIKEIPGGHALLIKQSGDAAIHSYSEPKPKKSCSFERIYFSRSSDPEIYKDRKRLGAALARPILEKIEYKVSETVFSYVPNTSEVAFYGLLEEILKQTGQIPRMEKIIWKDTKARTFITQKSNRNEMVGLVYEPTLDIISNNDLLVIIDDSIVRGTTLRESLLYILNLVNPKEVIFTSTAPIIKYPDCYGINMSSFEEFLSFQAAIQYYSRNENEDLLRSIIDTLKENLTKKEKQEILIKFYAQIPENNFIQDMANIIMPEVFRPKLSLIFQSLLDLKECIPDHSGTWYFDGVYPTDGGLHLAYKGLRDYLLKKK